MSKKYLDKINFKANSKIDSNVLKFSDMITLRDFLGFECKLDLLYRGSDNNFDIERYKEKI